MGSGKVRLTCARVLGETLVSSSFEGPATGFAEADDDAECPGVFM